MSNFRSRAETAGLKNSADEKPMKDQVNKECAIERMRNSGIEIITSEMAAFEWLEKSGTDTFRHISRNWLK